MLRRFFLFLRDNFITGIVVILPVILTIAILRFIIVKLNLILLNPLLHYLTPYLATEYSRVILAKTLIFAAVVLLITIVGLATRIFIVKRTFLLFEKILYRLPMVNKIYGTIKEISSAFLGKRKNVFKRVILIEYPRKGLYSIAFVTSDVDGEPGQKINKKLVSAYLPTTPNPTSGIFLLIPKEEVIPLDMSVDTGLKMVISSGIIYSQLNRKAKDNGKRESRGETKREQKAEDSKGLTSGL